MSGSDAWKMVDRVRRDSRVSDKAFRVFCSLAQHMDDARWVRDVSRELLAAELDCSTRTIGTAVATLEQCGHLRCRRLGHGLAAAYRLLAQSGSSGTPVGTPERKNPSLPLAEETESSSPIYRCQREREKEDLPEGDLSSPLGTQRGTEESFAPQREEVGEEADEEPSSAAADFEWLLRATFFSLARAKAEDLVKVLPDAPYDRVALTFFYLTRLDCRSVQDTDFAVEFERSLVERKIDDRRVQAAICDEVGRVRSESIGKAQRSRLEHVDLLSRCLARLGQEDAEREADE